MQQPHFTYLADYKAPDFLIDSADLKFDLNESSTTVESELAITRNGKHSNELVLDGEALNLVTLSIDGRALLPEHYRLEKETLRILNVPNQFVLTIKNEITPQTNTQLMGLFKSGDLFCTQCEPQGFRRITYFLDRPDVLARFTTKIEADKALCPVLLSNGNLVEQGELSNGRHWVKWVDPFKKPSYLFALVAGTLDCLEGHYKTRSGREVLIRIFCNVGQRERCHFALEAVYKAMRWDEETFGREYDLDIFMIVAINDFNMGAMENKGLNIFNAKYILANPQTATDVDFQNILSVVGHEYFHNWSGNRVTCRDWFQLSLKEGLTIFRDQEFSSDMGSPLVNRINEAKIIQTVQFVEDSGPMSHSVQPDAYIEINNFYTTTVYNKGAEVIRMMRTLLGRETFRKAMDLYFDRHDGQAVTIQEFVQSMEDASGIDLTQFRRWYKQSGTPLLSVHSEYVSAEKTWTLHVKQSCPPTPNQPIKKPFHIPLAVGLLDQAGQSLALTLETDSVPFLKGTRVLNVQKSEESFCFKNILERPIPSLLREFSAPVKLSYEYSDADLICLFMNDQDGFNRWEAGQQIACRWIKKLIRQYQEGIPLSISSSLIEAFEAILVERSTDKALMAELLLLPSESYISEQMQVIDVDAVYHARQYMRQTLAKKLNSFWIKIYLENQITGDYQHDLESIAKRALKMTALSYLMTTNNNEIIELCWQQFKTANNMTDSVNALSLLANKNCKERVEALEIFYEKWKKDPIVMDKWFMVQARSELPNTLLAVKKLMENPDFDNKNPNKLRSLIGGFTLGNLVQFHAKNGEGYAFLTDEVCRLNIVNPQIASRLVEPLTQWRRYDAERQAKMRICLEKIAKLPALSKDIYELVNKSLESC